MRFRRLSLRPYGAIEANELEFREDIGLHLVFGTNGAGKSTTLSALRSSLFGMNSRKYKFRFDSSLLRVGAHLVHSDGRSIEYTRRTSTNSPIWNASDDEALALEALSPFLGGLNADQFKTIFGLDLEGLASGGEELLEGKGDIGHALFGAGLGGKRLATVTKRLQSELAALHTPGNSKARINELHKEYKALDKEKRGATLAASSFEGDRKALAQLRVESVEADVQRKALRGDAQEMAQVARAAETLLALEAKEVERGALGAEEPLGEGSARRALELGRERDELRRRAEERIQRARALEERQLLATSNADAALLGAAARIDGLYEGLGAFQVAAQEAADARREMDEARGAREKALVHVGADIDDEEFEVTSSAGNSTSEDLAAAADMHLSKLQAAEMERDTCAKEARRAGQRVEHLRAGFSIIEDDLAVKLGPDLLGLAPFSGDLASLAKMAVPGAETIKAHSEEDRNIAGERSALASRSADAERATEEARSAAEAFLQSPQGPPPSKEELQRQRGERDVELAAALDARVSGEALDRKRALDLERRVQASDEAADRLARDSETAAAHRSVLLEVERTEAELRKLNLAAAELDARFRALAAACESAWAGLGSPAMDPLAMAAWAVRRRQVLARADELRAVARDGLAAAEAAYGERAADHEVALERLVEVEATWTAWAKAHRLDPDAGPSAAQRRLRVLVDVRAADRELSRAARVYETKSADEARFKAAVQELADELGVRVDEKTLEIALRSNDGAPPSSLAPSAAPSAALATARMKRLVAEKESAQRAEAELRAIINDLDQLEKERALDGEHAKAVEASLVELCASEMSPAGGAAGQEGTEALLALASVSEQLRAIAADLARLEVQFAEHAGERGREGVREALGNRSREALQTASLELLTQADAIDEEQSLRALRIGELTGRVEGDGSDAAANMEARLAEIEAEIEECAQAYMEVRVAEFLLNREVARYREETQGPILARAQKLFEILTLGAYVQLHPSDDAQGKEVMVARRPDGTTVEVKGMSTGTRDQLYLALRISSVEHMLATVEPMPFIADDLFVNFDDERTEAALKVLAELSKSTQVIVFSHHQSVVDTALRLTAEGVPVNVVRLQGEVQRESQNECSPATPE